MNSWDQIRIAYVEDQVGMRTGLANFFLTHAENFTMVFDTDDGSELIEYIEKAIPAPHLCILDVAMPKMDGLTLLDTIRKKWTKLPCLIYSHHDAQSTITAAIQLGANGYVSKNFGYEYLLEAIKSIIDTGIAYTADANRDMFERVLNNEIQVPNLTEREREFIRHASTDLSLPEIAEVMGISMSAAKKTCERCFRKLKASTRVGLTLQALRLGIINI